VSAPTELDFTRREWRVIQSCRTPAQVQRWLNGMPYNAEATLRSFRGVVTSRTAHCLEGALAAAVILEQHGYPVRFLDLASQDDLDHVVFLYQRGGRWGTVGRSRDPGLHGRKPVFQSLRALVDSYFDTYVDLTGRIVGYAVRTMDELGGYDWRLSGRNVWKVERAFIAGPIKPFHGADGRYAYWLQRYQAYKRRYPGRKPLYYTNKRTWAPGYPKG
jgi:hypothetical protein